MWNAPLEPTVVTQIPRALVSVVQKAKQHIIEVNWQTTVVVSYKYSKTGSLRYEVCALDKNGTLVAI